MNLLHNNPNKVLKLVNVYITLLYYHIQFQFVARINYVLRIIW